MIVGLFFVGSLFHHDQYFPYSRVIKTDNGTIYVRLNFTTPDAFIAQQSMDVHVQIFEMGLQYPNGTVVPQSPPLSNNLRIGTYYVVIVDARKPYESFPDVIQNYTGAVLAPSESQQKPTLQMAGNDKVIFPLSGDYTGYLLITTYPKAIPLGRVISVSPPEASLQLASNNITTGLSIIVVGLTLVQVGLALHRKNKDTPNELTNRSIVTPPQNASKHVEFDIRLAQIGMRFGAFFAMGQQFSQSV